MSSIGDRIVMLRTARELSQPELARRVGISQPSMHNIETGKTKKLRGDTLAGLCRELNVSPDVLLGNKRAPSDESVLHEAELLAIWRALAESDKAHLLAVARALAGSRPKPTGGGKRPRDATTDHGALTPR